MQEVAYSHTEQPKNRHSEFWSLKSWQNIYIFELAYSTVQAALCFKQPQFASCKRGVCSMKKHGLLNEKKWTSE